MDTIVTPVTAITLDSTRIVHSIKADLVARYFPPVVRLVQYDQSLPVIAVSLMQNGQTYTLPSGAAANIRVHKPDATYVYNPALGCDSTRNIVYFEVTQAMAAANGDGLAIVEIVVDGDIAGTSLITLHFEENPVPEDAIESSDEWETIYELGERIIASTVTPVSTAAGMTDHNVVYLYTGTETGWNQGHMYYYNGTTWVDAGIAVTDTTLSVAGLAADAKKTGDEIADLKDGLDAVTDQIIATLITDTASGSIASFPDGADNVPVKSLTVDIEPVQSGSGDPSPTNVRPISGHTSAVVTRTGKNLLRTPYSDTSKTSSGITVTVNDDGSVTFVGTATGDFYWNFRNSSDKLVLPVGTYMASINNIPTACAVYFSGGAYLNKANLTRRITVSDENGIACYITIPPSAGAVNFTLRLQIEAGETATAYEPYNGQTVTIDLDGTIYGGTLDVTTGVLTVDREYWNDITEATFNDKLKQQFGVVQGGVIFRLKQSITMANSLSSKNVWQIQESGFLDTDLKIVGVTSQSDLFEYIANNPIAFVLKLATPQTVQLTANEISTLLGQNNIWNDCGDTTVEYRADTKLYIDKKIAELA